MKVVLNFLKIFFNVFFIIILFINTVLILQSIFNPKEVPGFLGYKPYIVISSSNQTDIEYGDFVLANKNKELKPNDVVVVKTDIKKATTYSVNSIDDNCLKLENDSGDFSYLSKNSIEGKVVLDIKVIGELFLMLRNPIMIFCVLVLGTILGVCIYRIKLMV